MATVSVKTAARTRPFTEEELQNDVGDPIVAVQNATTYVVDRSGQSRSFEYSFSFTPDAQNIKVYSDMIAPLTLRVFDGYNAAVIIYGASAAGKGHTFFGSAGDLGMVSLSADELFNRINNDPTCKYLVSFSMYQIRKETIVDLLNPNLDEPLVLQEHRSLGFCIPGLAQLVVHDAEEIKELVNQGRKVLNALVKRGNYRGKPHFSIDIRVQAQDNNNMLAPMRSSVFRFFSTTGSGGMATEADSGLKALRTVVEGLAAGKDPWSLPYSASVVTKILEQSLGGNASTAVIGAIDPLAAHYQDSVRTLEFLELTKAVSTKPVLNQSLVTATIHSLREEIRNIRATLNFSLPADCMRDVDPQLLAKLKALTEQLEQAKQDTWDNLIRSSQIMMEKRKENLHKAGLYIVLEEETQMDNELMRKVEKERRNLVLQTYVVEQKQNKLLKAQARLEQLNQAAAAGVAPPPPAGEAGAEETEIDPETGEVVRSAGQGADDDAGKLAEKIKSLKEDCSHQVSKLEKMKSNFSKYVTQVVEMEEKQRKTFMLASESQKLHVFKDAEDWKEMESLKGGDPKLRKKLKEIAQRLKDAEAAVEQKYPLEATYGGDALRQMEMQLELLQKEHMEKAEELRWERDQLLGRLLERDFRHQAQMARMQKQMFMVFREYRRHFEEQRNQMERRYRKLLDDAVNDALLLQQRNITLEKQMEQISRKPTYTSSTPTYP